jgi:two-component system, LytTR family, response regulator
MKIRTIIVDDEKDARESIRLLLEKFHGIDVEVVDSVASVKEAVSSIISLKPELVFLDIEMPRENGMQLFDYFKDGHDFEVIFVTAFQQYALKAFRYAALDYLLKPVDYRELGEAIERYKKSTYRNPELKISTYFNNLNNDLEINRKIILPSKTGYNIIKLNNIIYCQAEHNYCTIFLNDGKSVTISSSLKNLEDMLPEDVFFRAHKSYLVNLNYVRSYDRKRGSLVLESNKSIEVAYRRAEELISFMKSK